MKPTIVRKIAVLLFGPTLAAIASLGVLYSYLSQTADEARFMNIAGRQRMTCQQILAFAQMVQTGQEEDRNGLRYLVESFGGSLDLLQYGGTHFETRLSAAPLPVQDEIAGVRHLWNTLRPALLLVADRPIRDPDAVTAFHVVLSNIPLLTERSDAVVTAYESWARSLRNRMLAVFGLVAAFDFGLLLAGVWVVRRYVGERKEVEEEIRDRESRCHSLFESANDAMLVADAESGVIITANRKAGELLGKPAGEIVGMHQAELHPPEEAERYRRIFQEAVQSGRGIEGGLWVCKGDGGRVPVEISANVVDWGDRKVILGIFRDVTERRRAEALRESEESFHALADNANDGILVSDQDGFHVYANRRMSEITGHAVEDLVGLHFRDILPPDEVSKVAERFKKRVEGESAPRQYETALRRKDGSLVPVEITSSRTTWRGKFGVIVIVRDVSQRRQMEEDMVRIGKLESLGVLVGGIAHDFNNILTAVLGNISMIQARAEPDSPTQERLAMAEKAALRARDLVRQLITFSRGGAPARKAVSIADLVRRSAGFALGGSNVRSECLLPENIWPAEVDEEQVLQALAHVLMNADESMPGGVIRIQAENVLVDDTLGLPIDPGRYVRVSVCDHGSGIAPEHLRRIFDPYFTTKKKGRGLGLAITDSIVRRHGGHVSVESTPASGTAFHLYFPASQAPAEAPPSDRVAPTRGQRRRVLVMDDEEPVRDALGRMLMHLDCDVAAAGDGAEAIEIFSTARESGQPFDAVIMDLTIPGGMGGKEAVSKILEIDPKARVIVSSGYSDDPVMADFRTHGFCAVLPKPYRIDELQNTLSRTWKPAGTELPPE